MQLLSIHAMFPSFHKLSLLLVWCWPSTREQPSYLLWTQGFQFLETEPSRFTHSHVSGKIWTMENMYSILVDGRRWIRWYFCMSFLFRQWLLFLAVSPIDLRWPNGSSSHWVHAIYFSFLTQAIPIVANIWLSPFLNISLILSIINSFY